MRNLLTLDKYRNRLKEINYWGPSTEHLHLAGMFDIPIKGVRRGLTVVASSGEIPHSEGWDHVSVSLQTRCPSWDEMCLIKDMFFFPEDVCFQLHPAKAENISNHRFCLHIWRNANKPIPLPPSRMVGDSSLGDQTRNVHTKALLEDYWGNKL